MSELIIIKAKRRVKIFGVVAVEALELLLGHAMHNSRRSEEVLLHFATEVELIA